MGKVFNSIGHLFAWVLHTGLPKAETVAGEAVSVIKAPVVQAIIGQVAGDKGQVWQRGLAAIGGDVLTAFEDAGEAIGADGLNVKFDLATVAAIKTLYGDVKGLFNGPETASKG